VNCLSAEDDVCGSTGAATIDPNGLLLTWTNLPPRNLICLRDRTATNLPACAEPNFASTPFKPRARDVEHDALEDV
jgi:hypothetical protein